MEVKIEVNDLRFQIFFVIFVDDQNLRLHSKISAFYLNYMDQTQSVQNLVSLSLELALP